MSHSEAWIGGIFLSLFFSCRLSSFCPKAFINMDFYRATVLGFYWKNLLNGKWRPICPSVVWVLVLVSCEVFSSVNGCETTWADPKLHCKWPMVKPKLFCSVLMFVFLFNPTDSLHSFQAICVSFPNTYLKPSYRSRRSRRESNRFLSSDHPGGSRGVPPSFSV